MKKKTKKEERRNVLPNRLIHTALHENEVTKNTPINEDKITTRTTTTQHNNRELKAIIMITDSRIKEANHFIMVSEPNARGSALLYYLCYLKEGIAAS